MDQVTFNGPSKTIECLPHVEELNVKGVYSEWKRWVMESDNSKYEHAFEVVGGEQTIANETIEPYFFLTNGWRIKPREEDHSLLVNGLLFATDGNNPITETDGDYTVTVYLKTPVVAPTTINYGQILQGAVEDITTQFMQTYMMFNETQKQSIRDAMLLNPTSGLHPDLYSIDTRLERIDINTQRFGQEFGNLTVDIDTTQLENRMSAIDVKVEDAIGLIEYNRDLNIQMGNKVDLLVHRSDTDSSRLAAIQLSGDEIKNIVDTISAKIDAL